MIWENLAGFNWLEFVWSTTVKSTVLLLVIWVAASLWSRASASVRHLIWSIAFYGMLVIMAGFLWLPRWHVSMPAPLQTLEALMRQGADLFSHRALGPRELNAVRQSGNPEETASASPAAGLSVSREDVESLLLAIWLTGFALLYSRFWIGVLKIFLLTRAAKPVRGEAWFQIIDDLNDKLRLGRRFQVKIGPGNHTPMTWGAWRPVVVLPKSAANWSAERLRMVLTHEAAHIEKRDYLSLIFIHFVRAFYWFHPLVWVAYRELVRHREHACDDRVLCLGDRATAYADHLLDIARSLKSSRLQGFFSLSMVKTSELEGRLISLLDDEVNHNQLTKPFLVRALLLSFSFLIPLAALKPWTGPHPNVRLASFHGELAPGIRFTSSERRKLAAEGISADYVNRLTAVGYRNPTVDQIITLAKMGVDPDTIEKAKQSSPRPVAVVEEKNKVCMLANELLSHEGMALEIEGRVYNGTPSCTVVLAQNPIQRLAYDPLTGKLLDKANAVVAAFPDGRVLYFESEENVYDFNRSRLGPCEP